MAPDSLACAALLFAASIAGWGFAGPGCASWCLYLRFAAVLLAALAVCAALGLGDAALPFLLPQVAGALATAAWARFVRRLPDLVVSLLLVAMLALGLAAALTGEGLVALVPVVFLDLVIGALALGGKRMLAALGALALLAGTLAFAERGAGSGVLLFLAAAIIGLSRGMARRPVRGLARAAPSITAVDETAARVCRTAIGGRG
jgi:hypothetical protein